MTTPATGTTVATTKPKTLDLGSAKVQGRFVEAFQTGKLDRLTPEEQATFLLALGTHIGVRAELGELMLYQGKPYITINGRLRVAHESGRMGGLQPRPATSVERLQFGATDEEILWVCEVWRLGAPRPFKGWGCVNKSADRNPVAKQFPREMAKKRAMYDALRLAFPPAEEIAAQVHASFIEEAEELAKRPDLLAEPEDIPAAEIHEDAATADDTAKPQDAGEVFGDGSTGPVLPGEIEHHNAARGELPLGDAPARPRNPMREGR